jgi:hypothetical protein
MGLFDNLFGKKQQEPIREDNVFQILGISLDEIPNDKFIKGNSETNSSGKTFTSYRRFYSDKLFDIFDLVEVKVFEGSSGKNIIISSNDNNRNNQNRIKNLVDKLFLIYGNDQLGCGRFKDEETEDLEENSWSGRLWTDQKFQYPILLSLDENSYSLTIWVK